MTTGQVFDGPAEVMSYYNLTRAAFPDQRHENVRLHHTDDAVVAEFDLLGTHLGELYGNAPTGRTFRCPVVAFFFDGEEGQRIVCERVYFASGTIASQLGIVPTLPAVTDPSNGPTIPTGSSTRPPRTSGSAFEPSGPRCPRPPPKSCCSRCRGTHAAIARWPYGAARAGSCTAAMPFSPLPMSTPIGRPARRDSPWSNACSPPTTPHDGTTGGDCGS